MPMAQLLNLIETELAKYRSAGGASAAAQATADDDFNERAPMQATQASM